jgi:chromate transporter
MHKTIELFKSFLKIGTFTIGGGYAMIPLFQDEFVRNRRWMTEEDFVNMLTVATASPGPLAVNSAVYTGYHVAGGKGVIASVTGVIIAPVTVIIILASNYERFRSLPFAEQAFMGIRPAVVGLLAAAVYKLIALKKLKWTWYILSAAAFALILFAKVDPVVIIAGAGIIGAIFQKHVGRGDK